MINIYRNIVATETARLHQKNGRFLSHVNKTAYLTTTKWHYERRGSLKNDD